MSDETPEQARLDELRRSIEQGFDKVNKDLDEVKKDVKDLHKEGLPRRISKIEKWRETLNTRLWWFLSGTGAAAVAGWLSVVIPEWPT